MFPACAGMNRFHGRPAARAAGVPRMRGDEPQNNGVMLFGEVVFPACAGMNRSAIFSSFSEIRVPRMRGDEPALADLNGNTAACSPHARG